MLCVLNVNKDGDLNEYFSTTAHHFLLNTDQ